MQNSNNRALKTISNCVPIEKGKTVKGYNSKVIAAEKHIIAEFKAKQDVFKTAIIWKYYLC
ncbi:hypothetical protein NIASO_15310 [Niabella soli DSM 19437]|uniref:Uncharacterized protein n=1 Tax=Niabella soli DSM 19437 TaxID=929713 RepID=W0F8R1_9BACT|nr:hypothetical protein NIASO_15310 [Niabella soli DSM 19437]